MNRLFKRWPVALLGMCMLGIVPSAYGSLAFTITQVGNDVVATGFGTLDITDLSLFITTGLPSFLRPGYSFGPIALVGSDSSIWEESGISGPGSMGSDIVSIASSTTGDEFGIAHGDLVVPDGYTSGALLSSSSTWNNATFASLGLNVGQYTYTWGSGVDADSLTISVETPEPSTFLLAGLAFGILIAGSRYCFNQLRVPEW